jgi:hypothetical protein
LSVKPLAIMRAISIGARSGPFLGRARTALSLRSENRPRLGNHRNQGAADDMSKARKRVGKGTFARSRGNDGVNRNRTLRSFEYGTDLLSWLLQILRYRRKM